MALYEIKEDCRIANKNYSKGDIVSNEEVWWYFPTIMNPIDSKEEVKPVKVEAPIEDEKEEEVVEEKKPTKKRQSKKK